MKEKNTVWYCFKELLQQQKWLLAAYTELGAEGLKGATVPGKQP